MNQNLIGDPYIDAVVTYFQKEYKDTSIQLYNAPENSREQKVIDYFLCFIHDFSAEYSKDKKPISVKVFWLDSKLPILNAFTDKYNDTFYLGLFRGLSTDLENIVINKKKELNIYIDASIIPRIDYDFLSVNNSYSGVERALINYIFLSIVMHELGHIACGHAGKAAKENLEKHARELFADYFSLTSVLPFLIMRNNNIDKNSNKEIIEFYIKANYIWWSIIIDLSEPITKYSYKAKTHPHPLVRLLFLIKELKSLRENNNYIKLTQEICEEIYTNACRTYYYKQETEKELNELYTPVSYMEIVAKTINDGPFST